jgi:hypothetical protein
MTFQVFTLLEDNSKFHTFRFRFTTANIKIRINARNWNKEKKEESKMRQKMHTGCEHFAKKQKINSSYSRTTQKNFDLDNEHTEEKKKGTPAG